MGTDTETSLIPSGNSENVISYLDFVFSHQDKITKKRNFISTRFGDLFPFIKLPEAVILKLLFNNE